MSALLLRSNDTPVELREDGESGPIITGSGILLYDGTSRTEYQMSAKRRGDFPVHERIMGKSLATAWQRLAITDPRALVNHDLNRLLGRFSAKTLLIREVANGDWWYDMLVPDTTVGRDTVVSVRRGDMRGSSFAFIPAPNGIYHRREGDVIIQEVREIMGVYDMSVVTNPAYKSTEAAVRSSDELYDIAQQWARSEKDGDEQRRQDEEAAAAEAEAEKQKVKDELATLEARAKLAAM